MGVVAFFWRAFRCWLLIPQVSTNLAVFDFIGDGNTDLVYEYSYSLVGDLATGSAGVIPTDGSVLLGRTTKDSFFESGAEISGSSPSYLEPEYGTECRSSLRIYSAMGFVSQHLVLFSGRRKFPIGAGLRTDVLIGVRIRTEDGPHFAWVRFVRPDSKPGPCSRWVVSIGIPFLTHRSGQGFPGDSCCVGDSP